MPHREGLRRPQKKPRPHGTTPLGSRLRSEAHTPVCPASTPANSLVITAVLDVIAAVLALGGKKQAARASLLAPAGPLSTPLERSTAL